MPENIESRIDQLLNADFSQMTTDQILSIITGGENLDLPYDDLQTKEGFEKELEKTTKDLNSVLDSLKPSNPPIPMDKIEELSCNYEGDSLYSQIILETLKNDNPDLYKDLLNSEDFKNNYPVTEEDIGVELRNVNTGFSKFVNIPSEGITKYLRKTNPDLLENIDEKIFDNLDPLLVGKPSNSGTRKKRKLNILGFKFPVQFIMNGNQVVHVKIGNDNLSLDKAINKINTILKDQYINAKPCDFNLSLDGIDEGDKLSIAGNVERGDEFDGNFYPDGDDPIQINDDCFAGIPEDPITGDPISTRENFNDILNDFCDPPNFTFESSEVPDPEPPSIDVDAIDSCLNSALDKTNKLQEDVKILSRWQMLERSLEEILYHYEPIYEYQKSLKDSWAKRTDAGDSNDDSDLGIGINILTYRDQIERYNLEIAQEQKDYTANRDIFLSSVTIFTERIFDLDVSVTNLTESELLEFFQNEIDANRSLIYYNEDTKSWPISEGVSSFLENSQIIRSIIESKDLIKYIKSKITDTQSLLDLELKTLSDRKKKNISIDDVEKFFLPVVIDPLDPYGQGEETLDTAAGLFSNNSSGGRFTKALKEFSVRYKTSFSKKRGELEITLSLPTDYGSPMPYIKSSRASKISLNGQSTNGTEDFYEPDNQKIKIGNEYSGNGGLLSGTIPEYLKSYQFLKINNIKTGQDDVSDFYSYLDRILNTNRSKSFIIDEMVKNHGILYGHLIEKSSSNWLFFEASERGDNNARNPAKNRPGSFTSDGEPNSVFVEFHSNFKPKWDAKYIQNKRTYIDPALEDLKDKARKAGKDLGKVLSKEDVVGIRIFENYFNVKKKYDQIKETILLAATKIAELNETITPSGVEKRFSDIKCSLDNNSNNGGSANGGSDSGNNDPDNCPPGCCGPPGEDFFKSGGNYLTSAPPCSDCPTIFQKCWWKQFCKDVTKVGLLPYPNGLPPIEDSKFFLAGGPSVRLGIKYWPVGYLPPAFIPIPIPNPVDGAPYIRIPLPMIWTIVPPIIIPLPFNLGMIVIFIPFIGGFMPSPLVYVKEFIRGSSFFLTGLRGPRFIPRKSDPKIKDPFEKIKEVLTFGVPDKLIELPGFGKDNLDSKDRVINDLKASISKIFDSIAPPGNVQGIRDIQARETEIRSAIENKTREYENSFALLDVNPPDLTPEINDLNAIVNERKIELRNVIKQYLFNTIPNPKDIHFPQDKNKLKIDIPGLVKSMRILKEMKSNLVPIKCPDFIDFKEEMREVLKLIRVVCPPRYAIENLQVANSSKVYLKRQGDPRFMDEEEFKELVKPIRRACIIITSVILWGNKLSRIKKLREGVFSIVEKGEYEGVFKFPPVKVTNSAPTELKFFKKQDPYIKELRRRIINGLLKIEFTVDDFIKYVRYNGEDPIVVIRVKDLKKILSRKLGLSSISQFDPVRPLDAEEPLISNFPYPKGNLACLESLNGGFGNAIAAFEMPVQFPIKQDQYAQIPGLGGMIQIKIKGETIKESLIDLLDKALGNGALENVIPEINDPYSTKFVNLSPLDIQKISKTLVIDLLNPNSPDFPKIFNILDRNVFPPARPTDIIEQILIGLGAPPPARMFYGLSWEYFKGVPKTPLSDLIVFPKLKASSNVISRLPWSITALLGRNVLNLLNPIIMSDDHPVWRRMSLRNSYYVAYIDEFLRSAADVSGLFKFCFGSISDPIYPIRELPSELKKEFNSKKY